MGIYLLRSEVCLSVSTLIVPGLLMKLQQFEIWSDLGPKKGSFRTPQKTYFLH